MICFERVFLILYTVITITNGLNEDVFIEELSRQLKTENDTAICRFRDFTDLYPPNELWRYLTGGFCYVYTSPERLNFRFNMSMGNLMGLRIPYTMVNETVVLFDFANQAYVDLIEPSFRSQRFLNLWIECSELAVDCCAYHFNEHNVFPTEEYPCPALWDGWDCWPATRAGETSFRICPHHSYTSEEIVCELQSEKYCFKNGTWNHNTNYAGCSTAVVLRRRHSFHVLVLIISTAITFPAVVIFVIFMRNQKNLRIDLNRNLLIAIILKNIVTVISKEIIILDALRPIAQSNNIMNENSVECRILTFFVSVTTTSVFTCMFAVGFYLHKTIARIFSTDVNIYLLYVNVIVFSFLPPLIWAIVMGATDQQYCWVVDTRGYQWITDSYKYAILLFNLILLLDIVRVIWLKRFTLNSKQTKTAVKATLVLIPLFGVPLLITSQRSLFDHDSCLAGDIYYHIAYSVEALQGIVVALLFCYLSVEVHSEIRKSYRRFTIFMNSKYGMNLKVPSQAKTTLVTNLRTSIDTGHTSKGQHEGNKR